MALYKSHDNLLCSIAIDMDYCTAHTKERMQQYAKRIDADFYQVTESRRRIPHLAKYDLIMMASRMGYKRVLYLDCDIYVRRGVPNIFEYYSNALFNEQPLIARVEYWKLSLIHI